MARDAAGRFVYDAREAIEEQNRLYREQEARWNAPEAVEARAVAARQAKAEQAAWVAEKLSGTEADFIEAILDADDLYEVSVLCRRRMERNQ